MSVGPPALGSILVQRLDAVLGTTMSAQSNLVSGARPDAVAQPGEAARPGASQTATRDPRQAVQAGGERGARQGAAGVDAKTAAALALAARGLQTSTGTTASAPTTLGQTARTILALLAQYPGQAPAVSVRAPLWTPPAQDGASPPASGQPAGHAPGAPVPGIHQDATLLVRQQLDVLANQPDAGVAGTGLARRADGMGGRARARR